MNTSLAPESEKANLWLLSLLTLIGLHKGVLGLSGIYLITQGSVMKGIFATIATAVAISYMGYITILSHLYVHSHIQ